MRRALVPVSCLLALLAATLEGQAQAQYGTWINPYTGSAWNNPSSSLLDTMIQGGLRFPDRATAAPGAEERSPHTATAAAPVNATSFLPTPQRLEVEAFVRSLSADPSEQAVLAQALDESIELFDEAARRQGRRHNVALAVAYMIAVNYTVYSGGLEVSEAAFEALWSAVN